MEMSSIPTLASSGRESSVLDFNSGSAVALGSVQGQVRSAVLFDAFSIFLIIS